MSGNDPWCLGCIPRPVRYVHTLSSSHYMRPACCYQHNSALYISGSPAATRLALHIGETTIQLPFGADQAKTLDTALAKLLQTFADKQEAKRPRRYSGTCCQLPECLSPPSQLSRVIEQQTIEQSLHLAQQCMPAMTPVAHNDHSYTTHIVVLIASITWLLPMHLHSCHTKQNRSCSYKHVPQQQHLIVSKSSLLLLLLLV